MFRCLRNQSNQMEDIQERLIFTEQCTVYNQFIGIHKQIFADIRKILLMQTIQYAKSKI